MITYMLLAALACPQVVMVGFKDKLSDEDISAKNRAAFVCSFKYKNSPCLVKFEKKEEHAYAATCGAKR